MRLYFLREEKRGNATWTRVKRVSSAGIHEMLVNHSPEEVKTSMRHQKAFIVKGR